ncbi:MAG: DHHA1 domain-containing protein [Halobacteriales archaeon]
MGASAELEGPVPELAGRCAAAADRLQHADDVLVVSHIDADGLTSAAIATEAVRRAGVPVRTAFCDQLDADEVAAAAEAATDVVWFTDFGSGQLSHVLEHAEAGAFDPVVADHHQPADVDADPDWHVNPLLEGLNGASELSGAGTTYAVARALGGAANRDLAALAVVGAVGDMQATSGALVGANEAIVEEGVAAGVVETGRDLALYGKQTRPLPKLLEYGSEVDIPGISNAEDGALRFLDGLGLELKADGEWRTWADLDREERTAVVSGLVRRAVDRGVPAGKIDGLVGTTYELAEEAPGTELRDASEFSTLLNATARYERPDVGLAVCLGDREAALTRARRLLANHRRNLSEGLELVRQSGITKAAHLQWFHAGDRIRETIVGIVAGMALGTEAADAERPIVAFADADEGEVKVSARGSGPLVGRGLDLSAVMTEAAAAVGGEGGGHDIAAGATIPAGEEDAFLEAAGALIAEQLGGDGG